MQLTYDSDMFVKTFESEFTWLNRIKHSCK